MAQDGLGPAQGAKRGATTGRRQPSRYGTPADIVSSLLLGAGALLPLVPIIFVSWMHRADERYMWVIRGPYPFDSMGSGPFLIGLELKFLLAGAALFLCGYLIRRLYLRSRAPS